RREHRLDLRDRVPGLVGRRRGVVKGMTDVVANMTMSLDGFIAHRDDGVAGLFDWYRGGDVAVEDFAGRRSSLTPVSAAYFRAELDRVGAFLVGRRLYDHTNGWEARPPTEAPMVVVTHAAPADWPRDGVPITFATEGIEAAVAEAQALAARGGGGRVVSVAGAATARSCLDAGLLDEIVVNLVPIVLGDGIPFFAGACGPVALEEPEIVAAPGVTHLRYRVARG
ncbi:MAG TPA: dihydrofolate reductase family protein, partial [Baekduia sp.]